MTRWDAPRGDDFLALARVRAGRAEAARPREGAAAVRAFEGLRSDALQVARLAGTGEVALPAWGALMGLTVLQGTVSVAKVRANAGETLAIPAALGGAEASCDGVHAVLSAVY